MHQKKIYSSEFNPIELLFNKCKIEFSKLDHINLINDIEFVNNFIIIQKNI